MATRPLHLRDASLVLTGPPPPYNRVRRPGYAVAMRVAAIDCGTNSLRLLVADVDPATGSLHDVTREMVVVRLGEGVDRTGVFAPEALERTFAVVDAYAETCRALGRGSPACLGERAEKAERPIAALVRARRV